VVYYYACMVYEAYPIMLVDSLEEEAHAHTHEQENMTVPTPR
jgi:hypothetical protein